MVKVLRRPADLPPTLCCIQCIKFCRIFSGLFLTRNFHGVGHYLISCCGTAPFPPKILNSQPQVRDLVLLYKGLVSYRPNKIMAFHEIGKYLFSISCIIFNSQVVRLRFKCVR